MSLCLCICWPNKCFTIEITLLHKFIFNLGHALWSIFMAFYCTTMVSNVSTIDSQWIIEFANIRCIYCIPMSIWFILILKEREDNVSIRFGLVLSGLLPLSIPLRKHLLATKTRTIPILLMGVHNVLPS